MDSYKLSPSDLTFLWDECPRCFYLKVVKSLPRPSMPFPSIFSNIDSLMKRMYEGGRTEALLPEMPPGEFYLMGKWVESQSIVRGGTEAYVKGIFDTVIRFDDGSYAVVDFKTSQPSAHHVEFYGRQLAAYAYALEHPAPGKLALAPVTKLGLICVEPIDIDRDASGRIRYVGDATWMEIPKDEEKFLSFIEKVMQVLALPEPPPAAEKCGFCKYRADARTHGW
jgi:CRISPR/Cas system-associated exonuclease Cas4 (RecB family)